MSNLKPCAHCGSVYTQVRWIGFTHTHNGAFEAGYRGECLDCGVITRACRTEAEAIEAWNTRWERTTHIMQGSERTLLGENLIIPLVCEVCGHGISVKDNYCRTCGARVEEDTDAN